jgi:predicted Fe-Mo cluster-binding NifX family protein
VKIAITTTGIDLSSPVDLRFGRAKNFLLYETDTGTFTLLENTQSLNAPQGAGIQSAQNVAQSGAEAVISGQCGPKAFHVLQSARIRVYQIEASSSVGDAVEQFLSGKLKEVAAATVEAHWV